ncbi:MAG: DUF4369 domain-containing protein [Prevotella sp.]|nr:DUF4369 domain-containing protein [Prevotella sp.]MBR4650773.1 DUF4369 domain-containing protein [Prevotella sp.]
MRSLLTTISAVMLGTVFTACTNYNIQGSSDLQNADGRMLYLKDMVDDKIVNLDSCDMVHGKFSFKGSLDSVRIVTLCIDEQPILPVVLEDGDIQVALNLQKQTCTGTPMNDTLNVFTMRYRKITEQLEDLAHQQSQAIMNGEDVDEVNRRLAEREAQLMMEEDKLVSTFITENFDNCLGPYIFKIATSSYEFPILTTWIEVLMTKATERFKNDPYVKEYMEAANHNRDIMVGVKN